MRDYLGQEFNCRDYKTTRGRLNWKVLKAEGAADHIGGGKIKSCYLCKCIYKQLQGPTCQKKESGGKGLYGKHPHVQKSYYLTAKGSFTFLKGGGPY